mgnify:CR=1 FL=1
MCDVGVMLKVVLVVSGGFSNEMGAGLLKIDIGCGMCAVSRCSGVFESSVAATRFEDRQSMLTQLDNLGRLANLLAFQWSRTRPDAIVRLSNASRTLKYHLLQCCMT